MSISVRSALLAGAAVAFAGGGTIPAAAAQSVATQPPTAPGTASTIDGTPAAAQSASPGADVAAAPSPQGQEDQPVGTDVIVTGIRGSIQQSLDTKRAAIGVVDAISAEDIGKLPDTNIADSMSRITGVQVTRRDGEGNLFSIRGLDLNRIQINGRAYTGPNQNATPSLQSLNPEILAGIEVIKSPAADQIEGSLGGTVNLRTRRPLDTSKDFIAAGRIQGLYGDQERKLGYRASGLLSKQFADGRFGVNAAVTFGRDYGRFDNFSTGGWRYAPGSTTSWQPNRLTQTLERRDDKRLTANGAIQWRPDDETDIVVEATYSHFKVDRNSIANQAILTPVTVSGVSKPATLSNAMVLGDGTVGSATFSNITLRPLVYETNTDFRSLNVGSTAKRTFGDLTVVLDGSYSKGKGLDGADNAGGASFTYVVVNSTPNIANVSYNIPAGAKGFPDFAFTSNYDRNNPQAYQLFSIFDGTNLSDNKGYDAKVDLQYDFHGSIINNVKAGARWERIDLFANNPQSTPGVAALQARLDTNRDGVVRPDELPALTYYSYLPSRFLKGVSGDFPRTFPIGEVNRYDARVGSGIGDPAAVPLSIRQVRQDTWAGYAMANLEHDVAGKVVRLNAGVRYVSSDRTSSGFGTSLTSGPVPVSTKFKSHYWLPSGNLSIDLTPKLIARVSAAKVIARPNLLDVGPGISVNLVAATASQGNPLLEPFKANQYDATLEWYFAPASILSGALFQKDISSFVTQRTTLTTIPGYPPSVQVPSGQFQLSQPVNGAGGRVRGFEIGYQHAFRFLPRPFDGLGVQTSLTYADSSTKIPNAINPTQTLPLNNLSKFSYSAILYYENKTWSARVAWTHRSKFLNTIQSTPSLGGNIYTDGFGQLDASAQYNISSRFRLTFDANGLNKPIIYQYVGTTNRNFTATINDLRLAAGIAANF